jgi:hypothetical protein
MKRFAWFLVLLVAAVVVLGYFRGWYEIGTNSDDKKANIKIDIDKERVREDVHKAVDTVKEGVNEIKGNKAVDKAKENVNDLKGKAEDKVKEGVDETKGKKDE